MKVFPDVQEWRSFARAAELGFVPTMGALHQGHLRLVERSRAENEATLVSLFVNPTQFDDPNDLRAYPSDLEADLALLRQAGVDFVLVPKPEQIYPNGYLYKVSETRDSQLLCGAHRPGHFDGMLTVVLKLLMLARAQRAYFGEKDFQQLQLVQGMVDDFFLDVQIVPVPTVREADGLAMSSRNQRLSPELRQQAAAFPRILSGVKDGRLAKAELVQAGFQVDYLEEWRGRRLGAVRLGGVRLIDNVAVRS